MSTDATSPDSQRDQEKFYTIYRGRHSRLRNRAYIRLGKVYAARYLLERAGITLQKKAIFDYGFGPGSFFLQCGMDCALAGLELDAENVAAVRDVLAKRGYRQVDLDTVDLARWDEHPLLNDTYDLVVLSHVLEHLDDPVAMLQRLKPCLKPDGFLLALLPLNEISEDVNHKWVCNRALVDDWSRQSAFEVAEYVEVDEFMYWPLPILHAKSRLGRLAAQGLSLSTGLTASLFPPRVWFGLGKWFGRLTRSKPTQAVFLLRPKLEP